MYKYKMLVLLLTTMLVAEVLSRSGLVIEEVPPSLPPPPPTPTVFQLQQCRDGCLDKHAADDFTCLQGTDCLMNGFLTYNFKTFPVALHLMCWNQCTSNPDTNDVSHIVYDEWPLNVVSMVRHGYLVTTDITWPKQIPPINCLVTWEVLGGGLMGSLFTETSDVELSLWPETKYNVQVTCKNKETKQMSRSLLLTLDTKYAKDEEGTTVISSSVSTTISNEIPIEPIDHESSDKNNNNEEEIIDNSIEAHPLHADDDKSLHEYETSSSLLGIRITLISSQRIEYILGVTSAVIIFICLILVIVIKRRKIQNNGLTLARMVSNGTTQLIVDKQVLLDNECIPYSASDHKTEESTGNHVRISY